MRILVYIFILFSAPGLYAQNNLSVKGKVSDETTGVPLEFCSVLIKGTSAGSQCDENGNFELKFKNSPSTLIIYKLGYETKEVRIDSSANSISIKLRSKAIQLKDVTVMSQKKEILQEKSNTEYLCFDFYDNFIIALVNKGSNRNHIQILEEDGTIVSQAAAPNGVENIFKDCFGNIQLLSSDSSYQLFFNYEEIIFQKPYPIAVFKTALEPCQCSYGSLIYMKSSRNHNLQNDYFCISRNDPGFNKYLTGIADSNAIKSFNRTYDINYFLNERKKGSYQTSYDEIKANIDLLREQIPLSESEQFKLQPIHSGLVNFDTSIYVVDFLNKNVLRYTVPAKFKEKSSFDSTYHLKPELIIDQDKRELYFRTEKKGVSSLQKFDLKTAKLLPAYIVIQEHFASNIKVRNGYIYFLYRNRLDNKNKKIYRQRL